MERQVENTQSDRTEAAADEEGRGRRIATEILFGILTAWPFLLVLIGITGLHETVLAGVSFKVLVAPWFASLAIILLAAAREESQKRTAGHVISAILTAAFALYIAYAVIADT